ncbi:MAG: sulfatase [Algibacter sp.]|uniref:sulfatase family protein n=1 Tax=Algibacter sp. TaxID=1872428 RepID=UPI00261B6FA5|nr:sulfatase [Algibacter sp.]MDG1729915.1 sulfatase [Algibacter sp.]MDG2178506.1 sulfatase [Algibacter sp.]
MEKIKLCITFIILSFTLTSCINKEEKLIAKKPNIIFILVDDQRNDALGCYGHEIIKSPNIDKLAEEGVRFSNAFVTTSICMASRATILTGMTSRSNGVSNMQIPLDTLLSKEVYPKLLKKEGYKTGFIGKFGFSIMGKKEPQNWFDYFKPTKRYWNEMPDGSNKHETELDGDYAIEFLNQQDKTQPFCLSVSFNAAHAEDSDLRPGFGHYPWIKEVDGMYEDIRIPEPRLNDSTIYNAHPKFMKESLNRIRYFWRWDTPEKYQTNMKAYYRLISGIDYTIGRITKELEKLGLADNTIIVYAADNGYYMGDRGFAGKWSHYEQSLRIPMIIFDPRVTKEKRGKVVDNMVLNLDLPSTFLEYAGVTVPKSYQGISLKQFLEKDTVTNWRTSFFCEHLYPDKIIPKWEGVRNERYKYAVYFEQNPPYEYLHDLITDPDELINLANNPEYKSILDELRVECENYVKKYTNISK